jgi:hypothetical protein
MALGTKPHDRFKRTTQSLRLLLVPEHLTWSGRLIELVPGKVCDNMEAKEMSYSILEVRSMFISTYF